MIILKSDLVILVTIWQRVGNDYFKLGFGNDYLVMTIWKLGFGNDYLETRIWQ